MRWGIVAAIFASLIAFEASAGSVLIYDGQGKLNRVVRPSPSGFVVYDGQGNIVSAVRNVGFDRRAIIDIDSSKLRVLGTTLSRDVSGLRGGVGFE
ncbi:MAG: hypothetical protein ACRBM6_25180 [Geminicoccales bacterium]